MNTNGMRALKTEELRQVRGGGVDPKKASTGDTKGAKDAGGGGGNARPALGPFGTMMYMGAMMRYRLASAAALLVSTQTAEDNFRNGYKQNPQEAGALAFIKVLYEGVGPSD